MIKIIIIKIFKINYPLLPPGPRPCPPWAASKRLGGGWWGQRWRRPVKGFQKSTGRRFLNPVTSHLLCHPECGPRVMFRGHCPGASERLLAIIVNGVTGIGRRVRAFCHPLLPPEPRWRGLIFTVRVEVGLQRCEQCRGCLTRNAPCYSTLNPLRFAEQFTQD